MPEKRNILERVSDAAQRASRSASEASREYGAFRGILGMYDTQALSEQRVKSEAVAIMKEIAAGATPDQQDIINRLDSVRESFNGSASELTSRVSSVLDVWRHRQDFSDSNFRDQVFVLYGVDNPHLGGREDWIYAVSKEPSIKSVCSDILPDISSRTLSDAQSHAASAFESIKDKALRENDFSREFIVREVLRDKSARGAFRPKDMQFVNEALMRYPNLVSVIPDHLCHRSLLDTVYAGVRQNDGKGSTELMGKIRDTEFAQEVIRGEIAANRFVNIIDLSPMINFTPEFRRELVEANPIQALATIPLREQTPELRLRAIARNPEAFFHIHDQAFCRDTFSVALVNSLAKEAALEPGTRSASVMQQLSQEARGKLTDLELPSDMAKLDAIASGASAARQSYVFGDSLLFRSGLDRAFALPETPETAGLAQDLALNALKGECFGKVYDASRIQDILQPNTADGRIATRIFNDAGLGEELRVLREKAQYAGPHSVEFRQYVQHVIDTKLEPVISGLITERTSLQASPLFQTSLPHAPEMKQIIVITDKQDAAGNPMRIPLMTCSEVDMTAINRAMYDFDRQANGNPVNVVLTDKDGDSIIDIDVMSRNYSQDRIVKEDLGELAAYHFHDGVKPNDNKGESYCFYDSADGTLDFSKSSQTFTFTSRDGRTTEDVTDWMRDLRKAGCHFGQMSNEAKARMFEGKSFQALDEQNYVKDITPQRQPDGTRRLVSSYAKQMGMGAINYASGKLRGEIDQAWNAGRV